MNTRIAAASVCLCLLLTASFSIAQEAPSDLPPPALTLGAQAGDGLFEGFGDILAPVYLTKSGLWFVNPRLTISDEEEEELNVGVGYRHLFPEKSIILGGNIYYDSRWTHYDSQFNQLGLGVECLSEWVDARANYYLPEDDEELAETYTDQQVDSRTSTHWYNPYAEEHAIRQKGVRVTTITTTTLLFERFEQAREGWDAEVGVKLPGL
ncbi:MAG: inverse autotransporter beta domain-containing protein, partial [Kiritimatiellae bacterium]|nr:inverse autotransporter beta domain-containing protein [Kiritimatiellia bacterium]